MRGSSTWTSVRFGLGWLADWQVAEWDKSLRETQEELFSLTDDVQKLVLGQQVRRETAPIDRLGHWGFGCYDGGAFIPERNRFPFSGGRWHDEMQ